MILLGLLLIAAAVVFGIDLLAQNAFRVPDPVVFGNHLGVTGGRLFFLIGALVGAAVILGLVLMLGGLRRRSARALDRRRAHREIADDRAALEAENAELRRHLDEERATRTTEHPGAEPGYAEEVRPAHERPVAEPGYAGEPTAAETGHRGGRLSLRERLTHRDRADHHYT